MHWRETRARCGPAKSAESLSESNIAAGVCGAKKRRESSTKNEQDQHHKRFSGRIKLSRFVANQSNKLDTDSSVAVRPIASPISVAIESTRMWGATRTASARA